MAAIQQAALPSFGSEPRSPLRLVTGGGPAISSSDLIYRRRRVVVFACALVLVVGAWAGAMAGFRLLVGGPGSGPLTASAATPSAAPAPAGATVHVVEPGETVWTIAREVTPPDQDVRATVDRIIERNGTAALRPGQRLVLD